MKVEIKAEFWVVLISYQYFHVLLFIKPRFLYFLLLYSWAVNHFYEEALCS